MEQVTPGLRAMGEDGMYLLEQYFSGAMNLLYADFTTQQEGICLRGAKLPPQHGVLHLLAALCRRTIPSRLSPR